MTFVDRLLYSAHMQDSSFETLQQWVAMSREWLVGTIGEGLASDLLYAAVIFLATWGVLWLLKHQVLTRLASLAKRTKIGIDDFLVGVLNGVGGLFFFTVSLFAAVQHMELPDLADTVVHALFLFVLVHEVIKIVEKIVLYFVARALRKGKKTKESDKNISMAIVVMVRLVLWLVGLLLILSNLGFNVNSLIASLGIGGLAISLALQNVFSDIFSSFSILIDKPFEEGDFIIVGEHMGTVKQIGLKTTRIQALQGEEIVISNNELTSVRIQNFKKLEKRRVVFSVGVTYDTSVKNLKAVPGIIRQLIESQEDVQFDRAHFQSLGDFSLNFEVVYYALTSDYSRYMDIQQAINLGIIEEFGKQKIDIAFPTQTIHVEKA